MEHHEVDMVGRFWVEGVSSLPTWHPSYVRRMLYFNNGLYVGKPAGWHQLAEGTNVFDLDILNVQYHVGTLAPSADNTADLGESGKRYANIYAVNFQGVVTTATYADLAEKYTMAEEYPVGTIMSVSSGEFDAVPAGHASKKVIGVRSDKYGFLLDSHGDGHAVGLVGKVPIRVFGRVRKGDWISCFEDGVGYAFNKAPIAIALETNDEPNEKLVLCLLKL